MAQHATTSHGSVTVGIKGNTLLVRWGANAAFVARAINPSSMHHVGVDGASVSLDWGPPEIGSRISWQLGSNAAAVAMAEDLVVTAAAAKRQEDPANGAIV